MTGYPGRQGESGWNFARISWPVYRRRRGIARPRLRPSWRVVTRCDRTRAPLSDHVVSPPKSWHIHTWGKFKGESYPLAVIVPQSQRSREEHVENNSTYTGHHEPVVKSPEVLNPAEPYYITFDCCRINRRRETFIQLQRTIPIHCFYDGERFFKSVLSKIFLRILIFSEIISSALSAPENLDLEEFLHDTGDEILFTSCCLIAPPSIGSWHYTWRYLTNSPRRWTKVGVYLSWIFSSFSSEVVQFANCFIKRSMNQETFLRWSPQMQ